MHTRTAVFIDGPNFHALAKAMQIDVDFKALGTYLRETYAPLLRIYYVTATAPDREGVDTLRPLVDWLSYNGFEMVTKPGKTFTAQDGSERFKGNMDVDLAVAAMEIADHVGRIVLFTGDGDFVPLVKALQRKGVVVEAWSDLKSRMIADELRRAVDEYREIDEIVKLIKRQRGSQAAE